MTFLETALAMTAGIFIHDAIDPFPQGTGAVGWGWKLLFAPVRYWQRRPWKRDRRR